MKKAIDIVLLPPDHIMELVIDLNTRAFSRGEAKFKLSKTKLFPHITLLMGCMSSEIEQEVIRQINAIAAATVSLRLEITDQRGDMLSIKKSKEIDNLHRSLLASVLPLLGQDCTLSDIAVDEGY